jgi:hypothetical protein
MRNIEKIKDDIILNYQEQIEILKERVGVFNLTTNKMTAVEWLYDQLEFDDTISIDDIENIFKQAKEMEKQQIIRVFCDGCFDTNSWRAEQYYNETFNK